MHGPKALSAQRQEYEAILALKEDQRRTNVTDVFLPCVGRLRRAAWLAGGFGSWRRAAGMAQRARSEAAALGFERQSQAHARELQELRKQREQRNAQADRVQAEQHAMALGQAAERATAAEGELAIR